MITQEEIQKRIEKYQRKYQLRKEQQEKKKQKEKEFKAIVREGYLYLKEFPNHKTHDNTHSCCGAPYTLQTLAVETKDGNIIVGYSFRKESDDYNEYIHKGLCGYRIKYPGKYTLTFEKDSISLELSAMYAAEIIKARVIMGTEEIPAGLLNKRFSYYKTYKHYGKEDESNTTPHNRESDS